MSRRSSKRRRGQGETESSLHPEIQSHVTAITQPPSSTPPTPAPLPAGPAETTVAPAPTADPIRPGPNARRDISQVLAADWDARPCPAVRGTRREGFQVVIRQSALNHIHRHGHSVQDIEVCGVLVGNVYHDDSGPWLYIEHAIEGSRAAGRSTQVTFTAETWAGIQAVMDRDHPDLRTLGWYHTHPGFGIFLSEMDVFIQEHFFAEAWQVALVYDPKSNEQGVFVWKDGKPRIDPFLVEEDQPGEQPATTVAQTREAPSHVASADVAVLAQRLDAIEKRQKWHLILLAVLMVIALSWPLIVSTFLPDFLKRNTQTPPPVNVPNYDDPTRRGRFE